MSVIDFKKEFKELYQSSNREFSIVNVPKMNFLILEGKGDPNTSKEFKDAIETLYAVSFNIKMMPKKGITPEGYFEYSVPPLEGLWWTGSKKFDIKKKDKFKWKIMIMQPNFVTKKVVEDAIISVKNKNNLPALPKINFESITEGLSVQIIHIGSYSSEPETISKMKEFLKENNFAENGLHHEIYLSDPRKKSQDKLKTILRQPVKKL